MKTITLNYDNAGGLNVMYAVPPTSFRDIYYEVINQKSYVGLQNRDNIIKIEMFADDTFVCTETTDSEDGGVYYENNIVAVVPGSNQNNDDLIETLCRNRWLILCKDNNGIVKLCGTLDVPLTCKKEQTTGAAYTELNATTLTFSNKQAQRDVIVEDVALFVD